MPRHPHEVSRNELLARLGKDSSPAKLLRWHHWGFLPQPRRDGHGRGGAGSTSYYPEIAVPQAHVIAQTLKRTRHQVEAGWALWVLGFREPSTAWARAVICAELDQLQAVAARNPTSHARELGRIAKARGRPIRGTAALRKVLAPDAIASALAFLVELELGAFRAGTHEELEYEWLREAVIAELKVPPEEEATYPSGQEMAAEAARIANEAPLAATRRMIECLSDSSLRAFANEAQILYEFMRRPATLEESIMSRAFYIGYLRSQLVSPTGREVTRKLRKAMRWRHPPRSPLGRVLEQLGQARNSNSSTTSPRIS